MKIDLKGGDELIDRVLELVSDHGFDDSYLWFNGGIQNLREAGFRRLAAAYPKAIVQCPVDFLAPLILAVPEKAHEVLDTLRDWCINRFSLSWQPSDLKGRIRVRFSIVSITGATTPTSTISTIPRPSCMQCCSCPVP